MSMTKLLLIPSSGDESASIISEEAASSWTVVRRAPREKGDGREVLGVAWSDSWSVKLSGTDIALEFQI